MSTPGGNGDRPEAMLADDLELARAEIEHLHESLEAAYAVSREQWARADAAEKAAGEAEELLATRDEELRVALQEAEQQSGEAARTAARLTEATASSARLEQQVGEMRAENAAVLAELFALRQTLLMRSTAALRRVYARVRGRSRPADTLRSNRVPHA